MKVGRPPIPHEHGAWVVLYAPVAIGLAAAGRVPATETVLLLFAITCLYFARNAGGLWLRKRRIDTDLAFWLTLFTLLFAYSSSMLLFHYHRFALLAVGAAAAALYIAHAVLSAWPSRKRLDRSRWGEVIAMAALCLTAPAAYAVASGRLDRTAWLTWALCTLFFSSSIFVVKMMLDAVKRKNEWNDAVRLQIGTSTLIYHLLLVPIVFVAASGMGNIERLLLFAAYTPIVVRALTALKLLKPVLPPLKRVGMLEVCYSLWFTGCLIAVHIVEHS